MWEEGKLMQSKKNVIILLNHISRESGGMSSSLDLAETLYLLGYRVRIGLNTGSLLYRVRGSRNCKTIIPNNYIYTVPKVIERVVRKPAAGRSTSARLLKVLKAKTQSLLIAFAGRKRKFFRLLYNADIIIISAGISGKGLETLRRHTKAVIVRNHAGSPAAFEDYWLTDEYLLEPAHSRRARYIAYCRRYDALLFQSADHAEECIERDPALQTRCFTVPPSCQEHVVLAARQLASPYRYGRRSIVSVGSIQPRKAQHLAIEAFSIIASRIQDVDLHFVGGGLNTGYGADLLKKIEEILLNDRIYFHGHRQDYLRFMAHAGLIIQTSEAEGVSRILREAMLMKCPVVSFAISGTSSLLKSGEEAFLVKPNDTAALAEAMSDCLENASTADAFAEAAYRRYLKNNSWAAYASNLRDAIDYFSCMKKREEV
jgi:glycosyltransferase involved in cell wall biosynthesis